MADPIIPDHYRAMVVFQGVSGLPEDRYVNTWFFRGDGIGTFPAVADNIATVLDAFYDKLQPSGQSVGGYINGNVISGVQLRVYELVEAPPRTPEVRDLALNLGAGGGLPAEVACCLSYRTTRKGPRGRGRIYLGPLASSTSILTTGRYRVAGTFMDTITAAADDVLATTENVTWVGLSRADGQTYEVTGGYVDDAFDTQRSRGPAPGERRAWGGYVLAA